MFVLFQRIWVFLIVDGFLLYIIVRIAGRKIEETRKKSKVSEEPLKKRRGAKIWYYFHDNRGEDRKGSIDWYPCVLGRGKHCDEVIEEMPKTGKYYLSREYVRITNVKDEFRVTRCQREGMETKTLAGTADGMPFEGEVSIKFREHLELKVTKQITKKIDVIQAHYFTDNEIYQHEIALYKLVTSVLEQKPEVSKVIRQFHARIVEVNPVFAIVEMNGMSEEITQLYHELQKLGCVLPVAFFHLIGLAVSLLYVS